MCGIIAGAAGAMIGGAVLNAIANVKGGIDQRNAARTAADQTEAAAQSEANDRLQRASKDAGNIAAQGASIAASQNAAQGASNVSGGTIDAAQRESNINAALDEAAVKSNAAREAWGITTQASIQATALRKTGKAAFTNGILGAAGGVLGAAGSAVSATYGPKP